MKKEQKKTQLSREMAIAFLCLRILYGKENYLDI